MKLPLLIFVLMWTTTVFAQDKKPPPPPAISAYKCIYSKKYSDSARMSFFPFNSYRNVKLVSFRFHEEGLPIRHKVVIEDSLIETVKLTKKDIYLLTDILYNNRFTKEVPPTETLCSIHPRHAILFFDNDNQLQEYMLFAFYCHHYEKSSEQVKVGDECTEKIEKLRAFFLSKGIKFGMDKNDKRYPGETIDVLD
jgi:hypothetical protein